MKKVNGIFDMLTNVHKIKFHDNIDNGGRLTAIEENTHIPFPIKRIFYVHEVENKIERGGHAHIDTDQVITVAHGSLNIDVLYGKESKTFVVDNPGEGIYIPRMCWVRLYNFTNNAVCLVLASTLYNRSRSIRNWEEYLDTFK